jgi:hypothetical protein
LDHRLNTPSILIPVSEFLLQVKVMLQSSFFNSESIRKKTEIKFATIIMICLHKKSTDITVGAN